MAIATFKFGIIADFVTGVHLEYGEKEKLLRAALNNTNHLLQKATATKKEKSEA